MGITPLPGGPSPFYERPPLEIAAACAVGNPKSIIGPIEGRVEGGGNGCNAASKTFIRNFVIAA